MPALVRMLAAGLKDTLYMTLTSAALAYVIGLPVGVILAITDANGLKPRRSINAPIGFIVNILRSVPFLILLIAVIPLTRAIIGRMVGATATIVPLTISAAPFIARLVESSIKEVDSGTVQAAQAMGASDLQIIMKVLIPEAKPSLIMGGAIAVTTILGYSAMAGAVGGGGLGDIAIRYGYYRYQQGTMLITVAVLVIIVQLLQEIGTRVVKRTDKRG